MMLRRFVTLAVFVAVLVLAPWMWASGAEAARQERESATSVSRVSFNADALSPLEARATVRKQSSSAIKFEAGYEPQFVVKFRDVVQARRNVAHANRVVSRSGANLDAFQAIVDRFGLTVTQHIGRSESDLHALQAKAANRSNRTQPDLAGILRVSGPAGTIEEAARAINALDVVEFVEFTSIIDPDFREATNKVVQSKPDRTRNDPRNWDIWDGLMRSDDPASRKPPRPAELHSINERLTIDSGPVSIARGERQAIEPQVVFSHVVDIANVPWIRLYLRDVKLSGSSARNNASYIQVTSLVTGEVQKLDAHTLRQWSYATAYFRGGSVLLQVFAYPGTGDNRVVIDRAEVGGWVGGMALSICDTEDLRVQSNDPAVGRITSAGGMCTAFLFNDNESCMLSAGHCTGAIAAPGATVHFNVPDSLPDGTPVPSAVVDQFPVLVDSVQFEPSPFCDGNLVACGNDWSHFGVGENPAGQTALQWQGTSHTLATVLPGQDDEDFDFEGMQLMVRGYGSTTDTDAPNSWSATQTEGIGEWLGVFDNTLIYRTDSTGGTSGGPIIDMSTGLVVGIHTCGGCLPFGGGQNLGTGILHPNLPHAYANPLACGEEAQGATGACCVSGTCFENILPTDCATNGGTFQGVGTRCPVGPLYNAACFGDIYLCCAGGTCMQTSYWGCEAVCGTVLNFYGGDYECDPEDPTIPCEEEPGCGEPTAGDCFTARGTTHCNQEVLCDSVCEIDPFCCDPDATDPLRGNGRWDEVCAWHARRISGSDIHPCFASSGDCESPNGTPGCNDSGCCLAVCMAAPECCASVYNWDAYCVELAEEFCALGTPDDPTPDFTPAQGYLTATSYFDDHGTIPAGAAAGLAQWHPSIYDLDFSFIVPFDLAYDFRTQNLPIFGYGGEGHDLDALWEFGELIGGENLTRGRSIRIGVLAPTAFVDPFDESKTHEDLRGRVIYPEVDQTMIINPESPSGLLDGQLGTAVLGIIGADPDNGLGIRGMAPDADLYFFPTVSMEQGGRFQNAFASMLEIFEPGDVVVLPYTPRPIAQNFTTTGLSYTLLSLAADLGIICVTAAGDDDVPIAAQAGDVDCQAIVVGAVSPGLPYYRIGWSNHCVDSPCDPLASVHTSAWGAAVTTIGYGNLYLGRTGGEDDLMRSYTNSFGGTAASSAQIGAVAAMLQGLAKQFWSIPLAPLQVRGEMCLNGFCQANVCIGLDPPGPSGDDPRFGDWSDEEAPARVGSMQYTPPQFPDTGLVAHIVFPNLAEVAEFIVAEGYFDDCQIEEIYAVRGSHMYGNAWSACTLDQNYYIARSMQTNGNSGASINLPEYKRELGKIVYSATGQVADIMAVARPDWDVVTSLNVTAAGNLSQPRSSVAFLELYDWSARNWTIAGVQFNAGGAVAVTSFDFLSAQPYVRDSDNAVLARVWVYGLPDPGSFGDGSGDTEFDLRLDLLDINVGGFVDKQD